MVNDDAFSLDPAAPVMHFHLLQFTASRVIWITDVCIAAFKRSGQPVIDRVTACLLLIPGHLLLLPIDSRCQEKVGLRDLQEESL